MLGYLWASPVTLVGLLLALLGSITGGSASLRGGIVEVCGGLPGWLMRGGRFWHGGAAMTLGHVILARDRDCLARSRAHEWYMYVSSNVGDRCCCPVYWSIAGWLWLRRRDPYLDHPLEPPPD